MKAAEDETDTSFDVDEATGCVSKVKPKGKELTGRGVAFAALVGDGRMFSVRFAAEGEISRFDEKTLTAIISKADLKEPYEQIFLGSCQRLDGGPTFSRVGVILTHELLGHGWYHLMGGPGAVKGQSDPSEQTARGIENLSHAQYGEPSRCF